MMRVTDTGKLLFWMVHKDLLREFRAHHVWPGMLLLGLVVATTLAAQIELPLEQSARIVAGMIWVAVIFAATVAFERSFANERESGCLQTLLLYPIAPSMLFFAKMAVNVALLVVLELVLIPVFIVLGDVPLLAKPGAMALIAAVGNLGLAALGTLLSALTADLRNRGGLLALLLLPLATPVIMGSAEATRMMLSGEIDLLWWRWIQVLAIFASVFIVGGAVVFEFLLEE